MVMLIYQLQAPTREACLGDGGCQSGLPVVDMANGADVEMGLVSLVGS